MILISDGNSEHFSHVGKKTKVFSEEKIGSVTALDQMP